MIAASALATVAVVAVAAVGARDAYYWDRPLPGVELREAQLQTPVRVDVAGRQYRIRPDEVVRVDGAATERARWQAGRTSFADRVRQLVDPSPPTLVVDPVLVARPEAEQVAADVSASLPKPRRAQVVVRGGLRVIPARSGDTVDPVQLAASLGEASLTGARTLSPALAHVEPELTTAAAEAAVAQAKELIDEPVTLEFKGEEVGTLAPARLAKLLRFRPAEERFNVSFHPDRIARAVEPLLKPWRTRAVNARFVIDGKQVRIRPSRPGLAVDGRWAADSVAAAAAAPTRRASLRLKQIRADLTTREADQLGIRERISTFTTDMGTSSSNRIHNVQLMARYVDGTIIKPGDTFSFNDRVGPRTVERGFREGQMIIGSLLLPSIGGGVCQTATTLFNNAFELGLPIVKRYNHSFYISHYPMGRDATVSWGGPDLGLPKRPEVRDPDQDAATRARRSRSASSAPTPSGASSRRRASGRTGARRRRPTRSTRTRRQARCGRWPARTSPASTSPSRARCTSAGSCCARIGRRATTSPSARPRSTAPAARSLARTSCSRACSRYCASAFSGSAGDSTAFRSS